MPDPQLPVAPSEGQLLTWARDAYGGITSYSKLRDPSWVRLHLGEGVWGWDEGGGGQQHSSCSQRASPLGEARSQGRCCGD